MLRAKPQFDRVPVALAKKILAGELKRKRAAERLQNSTGTDSQEISAERIASKTLRNEG
jgi:hypothetical protein